jgi:hypothetical protein
VAPAGTRLPGFLKNSHRHSRCESAIPRRGGGTATGAEIHPVVDLGAPSGIKIIGRSGGSLSERPRRQAEAGCEHQAVARPRPRRVTHCQPFPLKKDPP